MRKRFHCPIRFEPTFENDLDGLRMIINLGDNYREGLSDFNELAHTSSESPRAALRLKLRVQRGDREICAQSDQCSNLGRRLFPDFDAAAGQLIRERRVRHVKFVSSELN